MPQPFVFKWSNYTNNLMNTFRKLLSTEAMVDVTLTCEGHSLKAHQIVLSACSTYFESLFLENHHKHPIVFLKGVKFAELKGVVDFMYNGELHIAADEFPAFIETAVSLKVKGLAELSSKKPPSVVSQDCSYGSVPMVDNHIPRPTKRRRRKMRQSLSDLKDENSDRAWKQTNSDTDEVVCIDADSCNAQNSNELSYSTSSEIISPDSKWKKQNSDIEEIPFVDVGASRFQPRSRLTSVSKKTSLSELMQKQPNSDNRELLFVAASSDQNCSKWALVPIKSNSSEPKQKQPNSDNRELLSVGSSAQYCSRWASIPIQTNSPEQKQKPQISEIRELLSVDVGSSKDPNCVGWATVRTSSSESKPDQLNYDIGKLSVEASSAKSSSGWTSVSMQTSASEPQQKQPNSDIGEILSTGAYGAPHCSISLSIPLQTSSPKPQKEKMNSGIRELLAVDLGSSNDQHCSRGDSAPAQNASSHSFHEQVQWRDSSIEENISDDKSDLILLKQTLTEEYVTRQSDQRLAPSDVSEHSSEKSTASVLLEAPVVANKERESATSFQRNQPSNLRPRRFAKKTVFPRRVSAGTKAFFSGDTELKKRDKI